MTCAACHKQAWGCRYAQLRPLRPIRLPPPVPLVPAAQKPLSQQDWYHGSIPRQEALALLAGEGDFLVRESQGQPDKCVLSVMAGGQCRHFIIQSCNGQYCLEPMGAAAPSIPALIHLYLQSHQGLTQKCPFLLRQPVIKAKWNLGPEDVVLGELLGCGSFGEVYSGRLLHDNTPVAVKICREPLSPETKARFLQQARTLRRYRHPNIVCVVGACARQPPVFIVMELVTGGDLLSFLRCEGCRLWVQDLLCFAIQAAAGMAYLASHHCVHRALAAHHCLLGEGNMLKISNFGLSWQEGNGSGKHVPVKWTAPEALSEGRYSTESDTWSYGVLLWEIFSLGAAPYPGLSSKQVLSQTQRGLRLRTPARCPAELCDLMLRCWEAQPSLRPSFGTIHRELMQLQQDDK
ncbi:tyrosine-protein kinase Fes/Fps-like [Alligator sinensis]|uniref:Tyrosine-protein kinase n=1 Tax=Alligator sinensis TaxID=38654 RepID=A0A1U7S9B9_ALLSI|nr:tyrosine-protein kinase Fes/Fps-like [Alligator sinensis]